MNLFFVGCVALRLLGLAFFVVLTVRIVAGLRRNRDGAIAALRRRFAEGEIGEEEFRKLRDALES
jgi:uncharacterized membrane protein